MNSRHPQHPMLLQIPVPVAAPQHLLQMLLQIESSDFNDVALLQIIRRGMSEG
jgi:hypothetical protein